jgi:hypothetical protein
MLNGIAGIPQPTESNLSIGRRLQQKESLEATRISQRIFQDSERGANYARHGRDWPKEEDINIRTFKVQPGRS